MQPRISVITLGVTDLARESAFYEALGWPAPRFTDGDVAFFQAGPLVLALWASLGGHGAPGVELAYNVGAPEEVAPVLEAAAAAGGTVVRRAARTAWGGTAGAFADPEGYVWEVAHNPGWALGEDGAVTV